MSSGSDPSWCYAGSNVGRVQTLAIIIWLSPTALTIVAKSSGYLLGQVMLVCPR